MKDLWYFEKEATRQGCREIAGIDEAGRGPLAGPVVSAAVILPITFDDPDITDSKKLSPKKRERLYDSIYARATAVGIGIVDSVEIDRINILQASLLSMAMAVKNLAPRPDFLLIDGIFRIACELPQNPIPKGDSLSISIAAASIVAKVSRDRLMQTYHHYYPQFNFPRHKGYPTKAHKEAIRQFGCSPIHRKSFKGVKEYS
ncbi:Ribonuclease HII (EC [Olavius algarvensis Delta 1 endosymbiont]|nr:Ribonuclease HII (EC [Olavius algarvensis Delta 1 endosymbiont]